MKYRGQRQFWRRRLPDLAATQRRFGAALTGGARSDDALSLFAGDPAHVLNRLAIYRGNVVANTARALAAAYPVIGKVVGDEFFDGLAREYCREHPSVSGDLNELGEHFADFVSVFPPAQPLPYLPAVARLEWLVHGAHYAADHAPLDPGCVASITEKDYARLALKFHPAVALLAAPYPVCRIWEVHQDDYQGEIAVDLDSGSDRGIVYRPQFRVTVATLAEGEFAFLTAIKRGELLGTALTCALGADAQFDLSDSLHRWVAANIIVNAGIPDSRTR
jgi:hypothetical protein